MKYVAQKALVREFVIVMSSMTTDMSSGTERRRRRDSGTRNRAGSANDRYKRRVFVIWCR